MYDRDLILLWNGSNYKELVDYAKVPYAVLMPLFNRLKAIAEFNKYIETGADKHMKKAMIYNQYPDVARNDFNEPAYSVATTTSVEKTKCPKCGKQSFIESKLERRFDCFECEYMEINKKYIKHKNNKKKCNTCGEIKNTNEFNVRRKYRDGLDYACKKCKKEYRKRIKK